MKTLVHLLSRTVRRHPILVLIGALALTVFFGVMTSQQQQASGNEGFSPDSEEFLAAQAIADEFDSSAIAPVQVVFTAGGGDVITAEAYRTYVAVREQIEQSRASELFTDQPGGDVVGYLDLAVQGLQRAGIEPAEATDEDVKAAYLARYDSLPEAFQEQVELTLSERSTDLSVPSTGAGLMIVLLDTSVLDDDPDGVELQAIEVDMADAIATVGADGPVTARPFSFALLFADTSEFEAEIGRLFGTAFLIILLILGFVFWIHPRGRLTRRGALRRGAADVALALGVIVMSIVWMNGVGVLLGPGYLGIIGKFSELLQIIPILLIGLGVDYAIHLTARYREELGSGASVDGAVGRATSTVGVALVLATVTTAVGFLTNIVSPVTAVFDFGILAAVGIASAFVLMLTFVPAVRILLDRRAERAGRLPREAMGHSSERLLPKLMGRSAMLADKIPVVMLVLAFAAAGLGGYGLSRLDTTFSFTDFVPADSPLLPTFEALTDDFGGGLGETTNVLLTGDDVVSVEVHNTLIDVWEGLEGTPNVLSFDGRPDLESPATVVGGMAISPVNGGDPALFHPAFAPIATEFGVGPDLRIPEGTDVEALYAAAAEINPDGMQRVLTQTDEGDYLVNVAIATQAGESGASQLSEDLRAAFAPLAAIEGISAVPTNENIISRGVVEALQSSQASSLAITLAAAMALLVLTFWIESRRPLLGVITILPVAMVVLWVFGMMSATGITFNPVTAMIAAIAIGIGVPYTIHITHRYQEDRVQEASVGDAIRSTMTHTGGALAGSAFTTIAGFGILVTSTLKPFQQLGLVTAYAIAGALLAAVLVLPSMLVLWDRWHRRRGDQPIDADALAAALDDETAAVEGVPAS